MSSEPNVMDALRALAQEKGIDEYDMLDKLEQSLATTYQRILDLDNKTRVTIDRETGRIYVYELVPIGEVDEETGEAEEYEERDVTPADVSRIAAQNAKSVITGIIRDAERERIFEEYADRIGESVTGTVQQSDSRYTLIKLREGVEALLEQAEQPNNERYNHNERIKAYIIDVRKGQGNEPSIRVSRTHPGLIRRLFEIEVPEVYDGIVEIKSVAREAGARSKVAVASREPGLDPVGACVGPEGQPRSHDRGRAPGRANRRRAVERGSRHLRGQLAFPGEGRSRDRRRGHPHRYGHRAKRPAFAGDRQGGPERPPRRQAHRLAHRHQERRDRRGAGHNLHALLRSGLRRGVRRPLLRRDIVRGALPQSGATRRLLLWSA